MTIKKITGLLLSFILLLPALSNAATTLFSERKNYCSENQCNYKNESPGTVLIIHGMNSSMNPNDSHSEGNKLMGTYVNFARFVQSLGTGKGNFKVYGVDYNSDGRRATGTVKVTPLRNPLPSSCTGANNWNNCWNEDSKWESANLFTATTLNIRTVSNALQQQLVTMSKQGAINNPVTILAHSMGGLVTRDMLYNTDADPTMTGYEYLRRNGVVINEVVTIGTPHDHGFTGSEYEDYQKFSCRALDHSILLIHQFCMLSEWVDEQKSNSARWQDGTKLEINMIDFPQIHWVAVAGFGQTLPDTTPGDGLVAHYSAFYSADGRERFNQKVALKTSSTPLHNNPLPGELAVFPPGSDAIHGNINAVGLFPNLANCKSTNLKYPSITCTGFFQYAVPKTTLCMLPGYSTNNSYYRDNQEFSPSRWGCNP